MKIDLKELQAIFGDTLPDKDAFLANNDGHNISMRAIRKHVGTSSKHVFSKVWALFVAEYTEFIKAQKKPAVKPAPAAVKKPVAKPATKVKADESK